MQIILIKDDLLHHIFPRSTNSDEDLKDELKRFYSVGPFEPEIEIDRDVIVITIDTETIEKDQERFSELVQLSERGQLQEAKSLAKDMINKTPNISEYHRILGQIYSDLGDQDKAVDTLIDALRWNPKNEWALIMMGNIHSREKDDIDTAMVYYQQALEANPDDNIALNNIGANLMQLGKTKEAKKYFDKALEINPDYPNTYFALALIAEGEGDYRNAFNQSLKALEVNQRRDNLYKNSFQSAIEAAKKLIGEIDGKKYLEVFVEAMEEKSGKPIEIQEEENIPTAAKIEFAENYNREYHLIRYKPNYPAVEHLILHELTHLELAEEAREKNVNELFVTGDKEKRRFFHSLKKYKKKMLKKGYSEESLANYFESIFQGINRQIYNTPIDLFIEDRIYNNFPEMRPFQFLSWYQLVSEGVEATTKKEIVKMSPKGILSKSKTYNVVNALHFKDLYKVDLAEAHQPSKVIYAKAKNFYDEFQKYRSDKKPGEEYELVFNWAKDLQLNRYFRLVNEGEYRANQGESKVEKPDTATKTTSDKVKEEEVRKFVQSHAGDVNMAVVMYMIDAIQYFKDMPKSKVKEIAFEVAHLGQSGINPQKEGYHIPSIPGSSFTGYKTLAYYYTSWAIAIPEMLPKLGMPFGEEYEIANKMIDKKNL